MTSGIFCWSWDFNINANYVYCAVISIDKKLNCLSSSSTRELTNFPYNHVLKCKATLGMSEYVKSPLISEMLRSHREKCTEIDILHAHFPHSDNCNSPTQKHFKDFAIMLTGNINFMNGRWLSIRHANGWLSIRHTIGTQLTHEKCKAVRKARRFAFSGITCCQRILPLSPGSSHSKRTQTIHCFSHVYLHKAHNVYFESEKACVPNNVRQ